MRLEIILNAMARSSNMFYYGYPKHHKKRSRQYRAFRDRILRMDAEKDAVIKMLREKIESLERAMLFRETGR